MCAPSPHISAPFFVRILISTCIYIACFFHHIFFALLFFIFPHSHTSCSYLLHFFVTCSVCVASLLATITFYVPKLNASPFGNCATKQLNAMLQPAQLWCRLLHVHACSCVYVYIDAQLYAAHSRDPIKTETIKAKTIILLTNKHITSWMCACVEVYCSSEGANLVNLCNLNFHCIDGNKYKVIKRNLGN